MDKLNFKYLLIELYPQFYIQINGNKKYKFINTILRDKQIEKFVQYVSDKIDLRVLSEDFVKRFLTYAFASTLDKENQYGVKNCPPMNWIIAKSVFDRFQKSPHYIKKYKKADLLKRKNVTEIVKSSAEKKEEAFDLYKLITDCSTAEENEKKRFHNTKKGEIWCRDFTTLYNPKSVFCTSCKFQETCIKVLLQNYPKIYKTRL